MKKKLIYILCCVMTLVATSVSGNINNDILIKYNPDIPISFDLRDVDGIGYITSVKSQQGGTCWTHGAMAAMESNLMMTDNWAAAGEIGEPNLAEYHLDWWNGFNKHNNDDKIPPTGGGLDVHQGGDYLVTSAYLARGEGAVRDIDGQSYSTPPARYDYSYHYYYPWDIEWYVAQPDLSDIDLIKNKIMTNGALGTCMLYSEELIYNNMYYQPPSDPRNPNHAVAIVGWDDDKSILVKPGSDWDAPPDGAWLCKNSWSTYWGEEGYFWISYYDKHCCQHPEMGAVAYIDVQLMPYDHVYYYDYHGWRDTMTECTEAFNAFTATEKDRIEAVSFFISTDNVAYILKIFDQFNDGELVDEITMKSGVIDYKGFHTISLDYPITFEDGDDFYIYLNLSDGGHPFDRTSVVSLLLGAPPTRVVVESAANPEESYYRSGSDWIDLYDFDFGNPLWNNTANFCIKGLALKYVPLTISLLDDIPEYIDPGIPFEITVEIDSDMAQYVPGTGTLHYRYDGGDFITSSLISIGDDIYEAMLPPPSCEDIPEFYFSAEGDDGSLVLNPSNAPDDIYTTTVATVTMIASDDFETDHGWVVESFDLTEGEWVRAIPSGSLGLRGDPPVDYDGSGMCYVTGNGWDEDVDGGPTRLISPTIDLLGCDDCQIGYARWFYNQNDEDEDMMIVEISNDDGASWVTVENVHHTVGWVYHTFFVSEYVTPTSQIKLRFIVSDDPNDSVTEAAIDAFKIFIVGCEPFIIGDMNQDGDVNFDDINLFVIALIGEEAFYDQFPDYNWYAADCNRDCYIEFSDINSFIDILIS